MIRTPLIWRLLGSRRNLVFAYLVATALIVWLLAGCASTPVAMPQVVNVPVEVKVPVPVPCARRADLPAPPDVLTAEQLTALDDYRAVITLELQRRALARYSAELAALLAACVAD